MKSFIAIDPGTRQSAVIEIKDGNIESKAILQNGDVLKFLREQTQQDALVIEMIASYGMAVGREVFETCVWIGRFQEAWNGPTEFVYRKDVKLHLCGSPKAKDANIRQALLDRYGGSAAIGKKKAPGPLYGIKADLWAALAVAETYQGRNGGAE